MSPEDTLDMLESALALAIRTYGVDGGPTQAGRLNVAKQLLEMHRPEEAHLLFQESYEGWLRNRGPDDPGTIAAQKWLAYSNLTVGQTEVARQQFADVYEAQRRVQGDSHADTLDTKQFLDDIDDGRYASGES